MLNDLIRFEWRYQTRQAAFLAASLFFFLFGFTLTGTGFGAENVALNAPFLITESLGFLSIFSVFAVAIFGSNAVIRDVEYRMQEIVYSTPVGRFPCVFGRFAGCFLAALTSASFGAVGMAIATYMPWQSAERIASFDVRAYLWPLAIVVLPNVLFATALLFTIATLTRSSLATYAGAVFIYVLYFVGAALTNSPLMAASKPGATSGAWAALVDPFALSSFFEQTRYWSVAEKNTRFLALSGTFLFNRIVWIAAAGAIWMVVYRTFSFRILRRAKSSRAWKWRVGHGSENDNPSSAGACPERSRRGTFSPHEGRRALDSDSSRDLNIETPLPAAASSPWGEGGRRPGEGRARDDSVGFLSRMNIAPRPSWFASYASATRMDIASLLKSIPFLLLLALWMALAGAEIHSEIFSGEYGTASYPTTSLIVGALKAPLFLIGMIAVIYYGSEVFWREKRYRMAPIIETAPVPSSAMIAAKWTALVAMIGCLVVSGIAVGVVIQLAHGYRDLEPLVYASLFDFVGWPLALYAAAAVLIHALSPGKYVGMVLVLIFTIVAQRAQLAGFEHHLWRFATAPAVKYTAMNGFGDYAAPFHWFMLHWSAYAALFLILAAFLWRGVRRATRAGRVSVAVLAVIIVATGGWIFYNTDVVNARTTTKELFDWKADYEKTYARFATLPQPRVDAIETNVDLYPDERRYRIAGRYELVNDTPGAIRTVLVAVRRNARAATLSMPSMSPTRATRDARFGVYRFDLDPPLAPGARTELRFDLTFVKRGFVNDEQDDAIVENGSYVASFLSFPTIGYYKSYELTDTRERRKRGLGTSTPDLASDEPVRFAATVSTSRDQSVVAPGRLERTWTRGDRRYFQFRTDVPILNRFAFASARYDVARARHGDVDVEIDYHPRHRVNVQRMLDAATLSLEIFEARYGPYPHKQLRIAEVPVYWPFGGFALPGEIFLVEDRAFLTDARDPERADLVTRRTAHEVAHQWWGHVASPVPGPGASFIVESMTKYAELLVIERKYGRERVREQLALELDRYLAGRSTEENAEPPLARVGDEAYVYYGKGALVLNAIRDLVGDDAMTAAFRGVIAKKNPTTRDVLEQFRGARDYALIEQWMNEIVLYDLKVESARAQRRADGRYDVTIRVAAAKTRADGRGNERAIPLNETIGVGVFSKSLDVRKYALHDGMNELTIVVDERPTYVVVDPDVTRVDKNRFDNARAVGGGRSRAQSRP